MVPASLSSPPLLTSLLSLLLSIPIGGQLIDLETISPPAGHRLYRRRVSPSRLNVTLSKQPLAIPFVVSRFYFDSSSLEIPTFSLS